MAPESTHGTLTISRRPALGKRCELVAAGEALDTGESFLRRHLPDRDHLQPILLAIGLMHEQIPEVAGTARLAQRLTQLLHVTAFELRVARPGRQAGRGGVKVATDRSVRSRYIGRNHCARADFFPLAQKGLLRPTPKCLFSMAGPSATTLAVKCPGIIGNCRTTSTNLPPKLPPDDNHFAQMKRLLRGCGNQADRLRALVGGLAQVVEANCLRTPSC